MGYFRVKIDCGTGKILDIDGPFKGARADITIARITIIPRMSVNEKV
jgi:hypothetical protein